jgi:serine/threonine protein kinase
VSEGDQTQPPVPFELDGPPPLPLGATIAPGYRVVGFMRRGRDLDVYDLWSEERACRCIGKTVRPDRLRNRKARARARLLREGRLLMQLTHPHIVRAYEVMTSPVPLVILETLPGETLAHLIDRRQRRLRVEEIAHLGLHLCSAVGYLHRNDILHLDLKPSNIIATHGLAKVLDLSVARTPGPHRGGLGTRGYMAPEQSLGGELGPWTDVWGLGAVLFETATAEPACDFGDETTDSAAKTIPCYPTPVRRHRRLPVALSTAIDRCLSADPGDRPSVAALAESLQELVGGMPVRSEHPSSSAPAGDGVEGEGERA